MIERYDDWRARTEKRFLIAALRRNGWNIAWAARELGIHRQTLVGRAKRLEIQFPKTLLRGFAGGNVAVVWRESKAIKSLKDHARIKNAKRG